MPKLRVPIPRRRPNQPKPHAVYTFHRSDSNPGTPNGGGGGAGGTTYVLNCTVRNGQNAVRYTVATDKGETTIKDRRGVVYARIYWNHARYPRIEYRQAEVVKCKKWFKYGVSRL